MTRAGVQMLASAADAIGARGAAYGPPDENFKRIAAYWTAHLGDRLRGVLTPADVAAMSALIKLARLAETADHADSWLDLAGYAACGFEVTR